MADGSTLGLDTFTLTNGAVTAQKAQTCPAALSKYPRTMPVTASTAPVTLHKFK